MIRRHILWRQIWACTVCPHVCPIRRCKTYIHERERNACRICNITKINMGESNYAFLSESGIGVVCFNIRLGALRSHSADSETSIFISAVKTVMDISHNEFQKFPFYKWFNSPTFNRMAKAQEIIRGYVLLVIFCSNYDMSRDMRFPKMWYMEACIGVLGIQDICHFTSRDI